MLKKLAQLAVVNSYHAVLRRLRRVFVLVGLFSAVINVLMLTGSIYMLQVYDRVLSSGSVPTLIGLFAIVVVLYGFLAFYDFLRTRSLARVAIQLDQAIAPATFRSWIRSGLPGDGLSGVGGQPLRDLEVVRGFLASPAITALFDLPWVPLYLGILFVVHPWFGWLTVAGSGVVALLAFINRAVTRQAITRSMSLDGAERDFVDRSRRDAEAVHAMGMQQAITRRWSAMHTATLAAGQVGSDPSEILAATSRAFRMLLQSAILTLGAYLVLAGQISGGMIIASSILSGRALAPIDQIIGQWRSIGRAAEAHRRLGLFFDEEQVEKPRIDLPAPTGQISVSKVIKLAPGKPGTERARLLNQISFELQPGDGLGVIGNSAAGKSTLARLVVGAWAPDSGEIRLDGATPDQWDPVILGRSIGYLPQTLVMLPGSIRDNIARFDLAAEDAAVIAAATLAGVHEMILKLPDGYATLLGGEHMPLSGGQIQRLGLARAIFGMPRLVVLDEPNSNLDVAGDAALAQAITALRAAGSVVIVMAHRPSAIAAVNKVLILHSGTAVQFGDKETVLAAALQRGPADAPADASSGAETGDPAFDLAAVAAQRPTALPQQISRFDTAHVEMVRPEGLSKGLSDGLQPAMPDGLQPVMPDGLQPAMPDGLQPAMPRNVAARMKALSTPKSIIAQGKPRSFHLAKAVSTTGAGRRP